MKAITLSSGKTVLLDDADYEWASQYRWHAIGGRGTYYAWRHGPRTNYKRKNYAMHRELLGLTDAMVHVDHIDGNGLNNQRANLRTVTPRMNQGNRKSLTLKGVYARDGRWVARIKCGDKAVHLGRFDSILDAASTYDLEALDRFGQFARPNFSDSIKLWEELRGIVFIGHSIHGAMRDYPYCGTPLDVEAK